MNERRRAGAVMFAAMALAFATTPPALAQEATPPLPAVEAGAAPAATDPAAPAATDPAAAAPAAAAPAPAPAPAAAAEEAAPTPPPGISAEIITPYVIKDMRERIVQQVTILSITAANKVHTGTDQAAIDKMDAAWKAEAKSDDQPFIAEILSSPLSNYLLYIQASSAGLFTEIFVMDKFGLNVGQSSVTSDYWQGDEDKYQKTFAVGPDAVFVDEPEFDDNTKTWRTQVNFTVVDPATKESIGAVTVEFNLTEMLRRLQS
ncbi:hypothetical protein [Dongia mobilis]|uniref:hypothetical protein n=1 Tax=Dongia sp. TaxID=1977262 RepID=UPI0026EEBF97